MILSDQDVHTDNCLHLCFWSVQFKDEHCIAHYF